MAAVWFLLVAASVAVVGVLLAAGPTNSARRSPARAVDDGILMLAAATSLPELVVSCQVAPTGAIDMADREVCSGAA